MEIRVQISDNAYQRLVSRGGRIQGTIGLANPHEGNFNEHIRHTDANSDHAKYIRLRHGRVSVNPKGVRLSLRISLDEAGICPSEAIEHESRVASNFVDDTLDDYRDTFGY